MKKGFALTPVAFVGLFFVLPISNTFIRYLHFTEVSEVITNRSFLAVTWFSVWQASASTALSVILGLPFTWALARYSFPGDRLIRGVVGAPFVLPSVVIAGGVLALHQGTGIFPILYAHVVFNISIILRVVGPRWELLDEQLTQASATLDVGPFRTFQFIVWPYIKDSVRNASLLVFIYCFTSFGIITVLGGISRRTMETEIFVQALRLGNTSTAVALAAMQALIIVCVYASTRRNANTYESSHRVSQRQPLTYKPRHRISVVLFSGAIALCIAAPLAATMYRSFVSQNGLGISSWRTVLSGTLPSLNINTWTICFTSATFAIVAILICIPLALLSSPRASMFTSLPLFFSAATLGIGLIITFQTDPFAWRTERWLLPVIHAVIAFPLAIRTLQPAQQAVPQSLRDASATLGATPLQTWLRVELPLLRPALLRASGLTAAVSLGEFGATSFLSRSGSTTLPIAIAQLLGKPGEAPQQAGYVLASLMIVATIGVMSRA